MQMVCWRCWNQGKEWDEFTPDKAEKSYVSDGNIIFEVRCGECRSLFTLSYQLKDMTNGRLMHKTPLLSNTKLDSDDKLLYLLLIQLCGKYVIEIDPKELANMLGLNCVEVNLDVLSKLKLIEVEERGKLLQIDTKHSELTLIKEIMIDA